MITIDQQIACVERELKMRRDVYPRRVGRKQMSQKFAEEQIITMSEVLRTLKAVKRDEDLERSINAEVAKQGKLL